MTQSDQTPGRIYVWVCPVCGYWRQEETTGVHMLYPSTGPGVRHTLVQAAYIFEGEVAP